MLVYDCLRKKKKLNLHKTKEYKFYEENKKILYKIKEYYEFNDNNQDFNIIAANIFIKALLTQEGVFKVLSESKDLNKEELRGKMASFLATRPYLQLDNERIYLPHYSKAINFLLINEPERFNTYPYDQLDGKISLTGYNLFDEYGYEIYNSAFTNLEFILKDKTSCALYSEEFETIYVINNQGTLDVAIKLFDKYLTHPNKDDVLSRCKNVMEVFYDNKRIAFINSLFDNKLISSHMKSILLKKVSKRHIRRLKKQEVKNEKI